MKRPGITFNLIIVILLIANSLYGQLDPRIPLKLHEQVMNRSQETVPLLIEGNIQDIKSFCSRTNSVLKFSNGNIASINVRYSDIPKLAEMHSLTKIEAPVTTVRPLMDSALIKNNVFGVHSGLPPLTQNYTGRDVVIGIIDVGIYFDHKDFQRGDSSTRIRYIWDQRVSNSPNAPLGYGYGEEWSWIDIDAGNCTHVEPSNGYGHGTNVTGIAAGNGSANGRFKGVAPNAELVIVSINGNDFLTNVVDAIDYIYKKADALGKPCVINTSVGIYEGSHDGKDLHARIIENLIDDKEGRALVAAAGNAGGVKFHLGYDVEEDSSFTWFFENNSSKPIFYEVYSDTQDLKNVEFSFAADNPSLYFYYGRTEWLNVVDDFDVEEGSPDLVVQSIYDQGTLIGQVWTRVELSLGVYKIEVQIFPAVNSLYWRFSTKGDGRVDLWSNKTYTGTSNMIQAGLPSVQTMPEIATYKLPDALQNMVSSWQCSPKVITVANYVNRTVYTDYNLDLHDVNSENGAIPSVSNDLYPTSSYGPARTGIVKPDIAATGSATLCTGNLTNNNALIGSGQGFKVAEGGLHNRNGGTSMASPVVAGIVALYLEKNPNARWNEIKEAIISSAKSDHYTGITPNYGWGYGKVDAMAALSFPVAYGCTDTAAFNFDPFANVDDGTCESIVYGCTDISAVNYDPLANTDDGSCDYNSGIDGLDLTKAFVYPVPANKILFARGFRSGTNYKIVDKLGRAILSDKFYPDMQIDIEVLSPGIYYLQTDELHSKFIKTR
ncbi:MAG: S8 family serine peptidase [Chitinophagales bacterium]|nr:S8 family serine peptidase [Chitinophagales bacterium]